MATNANSPNSGNIVGSLSLNSIVQDLQQLTKKMESIQKQFNESQQDAKISEMVQDKVMLENSRMKGELEHYKHKLTQPKEISQSAVGMNGTIGKQAREIEILYSILKQYHIAIKDGLELLFQYRLEDENALKYQKFMAKNVDAAANQVVIRLCIDSDLSSGKALACAKFFRDNTCQTLPLPLLKLAQEEIDQNMKSDSNK